MGTIAFHAVAPDFTIYYPATATGWTTPTWNGYPAEPYDKLPVLVDYEYTVDDGGKSVTIAKYIGGGGDVSIPNKIDGKSVTAIGVNAFAGSVSVTSVTIPISVTSIGDGAFSSCSELTAVYFRGDAPTTFGANVFDNATESFTVYYPEGADGWSGNWKGYPTEEYVPPVNVTGVTLNNSSIYLPPLKSAQLTATVLPENADKSVEWSSSDSQVAIVDDNGLVTAVSKGTAVITVTTTDGGYTVKCTVTVGDDEFKYKAYDLPDGLNIDPDTGVITGTPTAAGRYPALIIAKDVKGILPMILTELVIEVRG